MIFVWALVALVLVVGLLGHVLLLGAIAVVGGYLVGRGHERVSARLAARRSRRTLGP